MIYHIYANRSNIGDWLSAKGIQHLLSPLKIQECLCDEPFIKTTIEMLSKAGPKDLIVIGGGGLFMDYFTPFWKAFLPVSKKIPYCIWGVGYCDLKYEASLAPTKLLEEIATNSTLCYVRDHLSKNYLSDFIRTDVVPCPSINIIQQDHSDSLDLLHVDNYTTVGGEAYETMCKISEEFADSKGIKCRQTNNRIDDNREVARDAILERYRQSAIVLSSALHGCIISAAMGKKVLAVSGDRKIEGFMELAGLVDWVVDARDAERIHELLPKLSEQANPKKILDHYRIKNQEIGKLIVQLATRVDQTR